MKQKSRPVLTFANDAEREAHLKKVGTTVTSEQMLASGQPKRQHKFTIVYRDKRNGQIHSEHGDGVVWPVAAHQLLKQRIQQERYVDEINVEAWNKAMDNFEVLCAYKGHQKQLI